MTFKGLLYNLTSVIGLSVELGHNDRQAVKLKPESTERRNNYIVNRSDLKCFIRYSRAANLWRL